MSTRFDIRLTPQGHLLLAPSVEGAALPSDVPEAFAEGTGAGLWWLGASAIAADLPEPWAWWRDFAALFVAAICRLGEDAVKTPVPAPDAGDLQRLRWSAPPMAGGEYLDDTQLQHLWGALDQAFKEQVSEVGSADALLQGCHPSWHLVGRVHVHLAENRKSDTHPFAFLATYTVSRGGGTKHLPLARALEEYRDDRERLICLLEPLTRAGESCPWLQGLLESKAIFQPRLWSPAEALRFLRDAERLREAGVVVRLPAVWRADRPARVQVSGSVGSEGPSQLGTAAILDFQASLAVDGEALDEDEVATLLAGGDGLQLIRGRWVEVDRERLQRTLDHFKEIEQLAKQGGLGFHEAMRLLAGGAPGPGEILADGVDWAAIHAGPWLAQTLRHLQSPAQGERVPQGLQAQLRPYQLEGLSWLRLLARLRLGACLADDMGLGKTLQILALLLARREEEGPAPNLLVAPASLLGNWAAEAERFTPELQVRIIHNSYLSSAEIDALEPKDLADTDLIIVSYAALHRWAWLHEQHWRHAILDEAQAIKNPGTRQARAAKKLRAESRIILTGTPVENRLGDLWSLFDFVNPGLLGSAKIFGKWSKALATSTGRYAPLRKLLQPYLLRRLKSDKRVIADLPDKVEQTVWCPLSRKQAALYEQSVRELERELEDKKGIARRGLILAFLLRFKQICNHPSQWLGDGDWEPAASGKFARLDELCETIAERQEKVLVFTQFRETTQPLADHLAARFGAAGLVLTGETPVKRRQALVRRFQDDDAVPFFVISLKAGGSGLNLTAASHVIHFDRWWNPAVENQATDRAYRIGQHRNVLVHKFTCRGTIEERIDAMIASKQALADALFDGDGELKLTELSNDELLDLVRLDVYAVNKE
ncbi:MAG: DEAD/DEAH box helicase [Planctomycetota bacterium]|jgi:superfamily II DNA or RNA helicase|nr:DEAD/DEAH box helicase [Planctomycetota bacterium]